VGLPPALTVATGFDAISHCVEAICSQQRQPVADVLAEGALARLIRSLPRCVDEPNDLVPRGDQLLAASLAGTAFSNAQVGLVHALSHPAGARWRVPHGTLNGIFLAPVMRFNAPDCTPQLEAISRIVGADGSVEGGILALEQLADRVGQPRRLRDVGVERDGLPWLAEAALYDGSIIYNPRLVASADELLPLLEEAW
jgi:alcohol dehydrogenase class IV